MSYAAHTTDRGALLLLRMYYSDPYLTALLVFLTAAGLGLLVGGIALWLTDGKRDDA